MAALERTVGQVLFDRGRRGVVLTSAGEVMLRTARRVLIELDGVDQRLSGLHDRVSGRVSVGAFPSAAAALVPRAIARTLAEHPGLRVVLDEAASATLERRVRSGRLDVAVVSGEADSARSDPVGLVRHELSRIGLHLAVPAAHRLTTLTCVRPADLVDEPWITGSGSPGDPQFGAWPTLSDPVVAYAARHWPTRLGLVAAGLGISVMPGAATPSVPPGVTVLAVDDPSAPRRVGSIVTRPDESPQAALLVRALQLGAQAIGDELAAARDPST